MSSRARFWRFADRNRRKASWPLVLCAVASLLFVIEAAFFLLFRNVNQDEGWYLWAAKLVFEGKVPYRDFAYSQTPLLPYVYGLSQWAFGQGLYLGRLTSLVFAALTLLLGASLVQRLAPRITSLQPSWAVACYLFLQVTSLYAAAYDVAYTAPYAPAACLLLLAFWIALSCSNETWRNILATSCLALAVAIRLSCAPALLALGLYLALTSRRRVRGLLVVLAAALITLAVACSPIFLADRGIVAYDIFGFHTDRVPLSWQLHVALVTARETGRDFAVPAVLGAVGLLRMAWLALRARRKHGDLQAAALASGDEAANRRPTDRRIPPLCEQLSLKTFAFGLAIFFSVAAIALAHLLPRTSGDFYNALQLPLLDVLAALALCWMGGALQQFANGRADAGLSQVGDAGRQPAAHGTYGGMETAERAAESSCASIGPAVRPSAVPVRPAPQMPTRFAKLARTCRQSLAWLPLLAALSLNVYLQGTTMLRRYHDLVTLPLQNQVAIVKSAAGFLSANLPPGSRLVTFSPQLALESGLTVAPGFEMSVFGYEPTWTTEQALHYKVINNALLLEALNDGTGAVAFSDFDLNNELAGLRPALSAALARSYRWEETAPGAGPIQDDVRIYLPPRFGPPKVGNPEHVTFAGGIELLGYDLTPGPYQRGQPIRFALYWQAMTPPSLSYTIFAHLLDSQGTLAAGWDNPPCHGTCPTNTWRARETIRDEYSLSLDRGCQAGSYRLEIGLYNPATSQRLPLLATPGQARGDRVLLTTFPVQ
jgi:hypothetical protein